MEEADFKKKLKEKSEQLFCTIKDINTEKIIKYVINSEITMWRAQSLFTKEPITIQWIRGFEPNSIFFDVGANVGMYSIFAACVSKALVYSFEPESNNYQTLMENIILNNFSDKIIPYQIGLNNETLFTSLYLSSFKKGDSHHMVGEDLDHNLKKKKSTYRQGIFSTTLNELIGNWNFPVPNYLKIDVDGIEYKIVSSGNDLFLDKNLKSVLIEINSNREEDKKIIELLKSFGFIYDLKQVESATRKSGLHKGYAEYLFYRA